MAEQLPSDKVTLTPADASAVDAILGGETDTAPSAARDAAREARVNQWLNVLAAVPAPTAPADLAHRTLARLADERMKFASAQDAAATTDAKVDILVRRRWSRRMAELGAMAIAASLLIAVAVVGVNQAHQSKMRTLCYENLHKMSAAFANYATANSNALPSLETPANRNWLVNISEGPRNNSANLLPLINGSYITLANLYCPANAPASPPESTATSVGDIGYSYTHLYGPARPTWDGRAATIILADRNPLFLPTSPGGPGPGGVKPDANSTNHGGHGNYLLRADASVAWSTTPNAGPSNDNIWTIARAPGSKERITSYTGTEVPTGPGDAFLCP